MLSFFFFLCLLPVIWMQGGCDTCDMGAVDVCFPCFLRSCFVLQVYEACCSPNMSYHSYACVHENNKASRTKQEE
ncbi:hypothetical protein GW17_00041452 [Ensete ventricosum]|nr:hypothetical protein GW17_00041452 [Ensete ventricosum]RZS02014.1 hypothetical protein BHM03_00031995 [Ensete ventricosum]